MNKRIDAAGAAALVRDGMTVMIGGFLALGTPKSVVAEIVKSGVTGLTVICNDAGEPDLGVGQLVAAGKVKKLIASHIARNPLVRQFADEGKMELELAPQGTLAERIRAGGAGLGGVLTPTGLGTEVAEGKDTVIVDGKEYLLEKPLRADVSLICASIADESGNLFYKGTKRNFCPLMALAADVVIAGTEELVLVGGIMPENVVTPGILVDYIVEGEEP